MPQKTRRRKTQAKAKSSKPTKPPTASAEPVQFDLDWPALHVADNVRPGVAKCCIWLGRASFRIALVSVAYADWANLVKAHTVVESETEYERDLVSGVPLLDRPLQKEKRQFRSDLGKLEWDYSADPPKQVLVPLTPEACRNMCETRGRELRRFFECMLAVIQEAKKATQGIAEELNSSDPHTEETKIRTCLYELEKRLRLYVPDEYSPFLAIANAAGFCEFVDSHKIAKKLNDLERGLERNGVVGPRLSRDEINVKASKYLKEHPKATARALSKGIGCSLGVVTDLPAWQALKKERARDRKPKPPTVVSFTDKMQAVIGEGEDEALKQLIGEEEEEEKGKALKQAIAEHKADFEPNSLGDDDPAAPPRRVMRSRAG